MAMSTSSAAALTRTAQNKLKNLASDAIRIPTTQELYARKSAEITEAKRKLDATISRLIALEKEQPSRRGGYDELLAAKARQEATIERLCSEGGILKQGLIDARPKPPLTPRQKLWMDSLPVLPVSPYTKDEMQAAKDEVERIVQQKRMARFNGDRHAEEALAPAYKEAKLKLDVLCGGYRGEWPPYMPYATRDDMAVALKKWGKK